MTALMVQGCTSWAGKSLLTTALCRWFARQGARVAPFKAQNMSNNARVTPGGEIGVAQWLQARAAGVAPEVRMNPVLVKPEAGGSQVVRMGRVDRELSGRAWRDRAPALWPTIETALAGLLAAYDLVVIEGAGSPAELNLAPYDVVNMRVAARAGAPVLLAVDIDRGGAFAHLYGTWALLEHRHRTRVAGFVLNRFRGDPDLLPPGPERLAQLTGVPTIGVVPMLDHDLPDEDGAAVRPPRRGGLPRVAVLRYPAASNLDEFAPLAQVADVRWATAPEHLDGATAVVLPGSKHVAADLAWLRATGLGEAVRAAAGAGTRVLGICGGMQLLGTRVDDPHGTEGEGGGGTPASGDAGSGDALALLPLATTLAPAKLVGPRRLRLPADLPAPWRPLAGREVAGYEIRHGRTVVHGPVDTVAEDPAGVLLAARGNVAGWYLHGVLEDPEVLTGLFGAPPGRTLEDTFTRLADAVDEHLDTALLRRLAGWP